MLFIGVGLPVRREGGLQSVVRFKGSRQVLLQPSLRRFLCSEMAKQIGRRAGLQQTGGPSIVVLVSGEIGMGDPG